VQREPRAQSDSKPDGLADNRPPTSDTPPDFERKESWLSVLRSRPAMAQATTSTPQIAGSMAGEYRIGALLGEGGFGAVYAAQHPVLKRSAAVKVLHRAAGVDSDAVQRFIAEARVVNQISNRHIVDIFSFGQLADGRHFYVMDLLEGEPLDRWLKREERCDVADALSLLRPIAEALETAHEAGVVHRDLKPQNIFLCWESGGTTVPKLLDFGMAKLLENPSVLTESGTPLGTPLYMSPEQARGETVDPRSDIYSLGVLAHELLTGRLPFTATSSVAVLVAHLTQEPQRPSQVHPGLPSALDEPLLKMLAKDAANRPRSAVAAIECLVEAAEAAGVTVPAGYPHLPPPPTTPKPIDPFMVQPTEPQHSTSRPRRRRSLAWWAGGLLIATALVALALSSLSQRPAPPDEQRGPVASVATIGALSPPAGAVSVETARSVNSSASSHAPSDSSPAISPQAPKPQRVQIEILDAPAGARLSVGQEELGRAPGPIEIPFGTEPVSIRIEATGYAGRSVDVVPDRPSSVHAALDRIAHKREELVPKAKSSGSAASDSVSSDLENPFK